MRLLTVRIYVENIISRKIDLLLPDITISLQNLNLFCAQWTVPPSMKLIVQGKYQEIILQILLQLTH